jgi:hypothetical protein
MQTSCGLVAGLPWICFGPLMVLLLLWLGSLVFTILALLCRCCSSVLALLNVALLLFCCGSVLAPYFNFLEPFLQTSKPNTHKSAYKNGWLLECISVSNNCFLPSTGWIIMLFKTLYPIIHKIFKIMHHKLYVLFFFSVLLINCCRVCVCTKLYIVLYCTYIYIL